MSVGIDFAVNFAAAMALGGAAASWQRVESRFRTRGPRRFWRPFIEVGQVRVIIGGPALDENAWERSGMMGVGDALALRDLQSAFARIGADADVRFTSHTARWKNPTRYWHCGSRQAAVVGPPASFPA